MDPKKSRHLYKYFPLADRFVRIRVCDARGAEFSAIGELSGAAYRRAVIDRCVELGEESVASWAARLAPEDPELAIASLYALVTAVNPELEIHSVALREPHPGVEASPEASARAESAWLAHLARRSRGLAKRLAARVIGQSEAIEAVSRAVHRAAAGLADERRPLATLLFMGRTGTGKTELARALAQDLGGAKRLVRVDCSEFGEAHEYAKLIGAPPGYVGHGEGGMLTEALKRSPESVVLFDEIEKAHPRMHHLLLQVLDEGRLTDGRGQTIDFRRAFLVLTSNTGTRELARASERLGFAQEKLARAANAEIASRALADAFRPEFLARIDETIHFRDLTRADAQEIALNMLTDLALRARKRGRRVRFSPAVARWIVERGFSDAEGARGLVHVVRRDVEAPLADAFLSRSSARIAVTIRAGKPRFARAA